MSYVIRDVHCRRSDAAHGVGDIEVNLARISLDRYVVGVWEASFFAENLVESIDFSGITMEDLQKARLSSGSTKTVSNLCSFRIS